MHRVVFYLLCCTASLAWASERLGPDLIPRNNYLASNGRRSLVITDLGLTSGYLESFHVYVHPLPEDHRLPRLRLQVWTENQVERGISFTLKWEMTADFTQGPDRRYEFPVPSGEFVRLEQNDHVGMTSEGDLNPVTYDFEEHRAVFFRQVTEAGLPLPELGSPLPFDPIPYPAIFSFGVNITQEMPMPPSEGSLVYFGNALYRRAHIDPPDVRRSWTDGVVVPEAGMLVTYHFFTGDIGEGSPRVCLQIWTVIDTENSAVFMLKWEKRVQLTEGGNRLYKFTIPASESVYVTRNDRIGFTFYDVIATIPSSFSGDHKSYMLALSGDQRPQIGEEHNFDSLPMPKQYSVGITVDTTAPPPQPSIPDGDATAESSPPDPIDGDDQDIGIRTVRPVIDANELNPFSSASSLCISFLLALAPLFIVGTVL